MDAQITSPIINNAVATYLVGPWTNFPPLGLPVVIMGGHPNNAAVVWEYRALHPSEIGDESKSLALVEKLNEIGSEGWELSATTKEGALLFKRCKKLDLTDPGPTARSDDL